MFALLSLTFILLEVSAQYQTGPIQPVVLSSAQFHSGTLSATSEDAAQDLQFYSFFVPENTAYVTISASQTDSACSSLALYLSTYNYPCSTDQFPYYYGFQCSLADKQSSILFYQTESYQVSTREILFRRRTDSRTEKILSRLPSIVPGTSLLEDPHSLITRTLARTALDSASMLVRIVESLHFNM